MSYILDALKKVEQESELGRVPDIASHHETVAPQPPVRYWHWVVGAALVMNVVVLAYVLWPEGKPIDRGVESMATKPAPAAVAEPVRSPRPAVSRAMPNTPPPQPAAPTPAPAKAATEKPALASTVAEERSLIPLPLRQTPPVAQPTPDREISKPAPATVPDRAPTVAATTIRKTLPAQPLTAAATSAESLPLWPLVSDAVANRIPGRLKLNVHVFSRNPEGRFVMLNMKKYNEGERILEGPYLEMITERGVILSIDGERFRLNAP